MNDYLVPYGSGEAEYVEKRSRFIGRVWPAESESRALELIKQTREKHWDATHNVYAYIIREGGIMRYSDDGEPQGTSGVPTLNVFREENIFNFCCVVTRYFGGTLLGTGGLVRAYSHTAKLALDSAGIAEMRLWKRARIDCEYSQYEKLHSETEAFGGTVENTDFASRVTMSLLLPENEAPSFSARVTDITAGTVRPDFQGAEFRAFRIK